MFLAAQSLGTPWPCANVAEQTRTKAKLHNLVEVSVL